MYMYLVSCSFVVSWVSHSACADPEGGGGVDSGSGTPLNNHKAIGFLSNTVPDPLKNHKGTTSIQC